MSIDDWEQRMASETAEVDSWYNEEEWGYSNPQCEADGHDFEEEERFAEMLLVCQRCGFEEWY